MSNMNLSSKISQMFSTARIYCLISIVSAHLIFPNTYAADFLSRLGTVGVVLFLIISGYFFRPQNFDNFWSLVKKKARTICIPWFTLGSITWMYNAFLSNHFRSVTGYINWILGNKTYLYYMPVLLVCFLVFYKAPKAVLFTAIPLNVCSIILTATGVLDSVVSSLGITHYLNVFNWIGFFALGMLLQLADSEKIYAFFKKFRFLAISLFVIAFVLLLIFRNIRFDYFSYVAIPYELIGGAAILSLSTFSLTKYRVFKKLSNYSFAIFLIHMIFIGLFDSILAKTIVTMFLSPIIIIGIVFVCFWLVEWLSGKAKLGKVYQLLVGIRNN